MALPKWTDERTQQLVDFVGSESPISQATVASAAEELETSTRSVSSKLRKMGHDVELASSVSNRTFSEDQEATLQAFVTDNSGQYTYADIASSFESGAFSAKSIRPPSLYCWIESFNCLAEDVMTLMHSFVVKFFP